MQRLLLLFLVLAGCARVPQTFSEIQFSPVGTLSFPVTPDQTWGSRGQQIFYQDGKSYLASYDEPRKEISIYDISQKSRVALIPVSPFKSSRDNIWFFHVHNLDSVFVHFNASYHPNYWHDSTLMLLDVQGKIKDVFELTSAPVWTEANPDISPDAAYYTAGVALGYQNGQLWIPMTRWSLGIGDTAFSNPATHPLGLLHIDTSPDSFSFHPFVTPARPGEYFPFQTNMPRFTANANNNPIIALIHSPNLWVLNSTGAQQFRLPSIAFDSMPPLSVGVPISREERNIAPGSGLYFSPKYDPFRNVYWRSMNYPIDSAEEAGMSTRARSGVVLADEHFQVIGEGLMPEGYVFGFPVPEGVALRRLPQGESTVQDSITFEIFSYEILKHASIKAYREKAIVPGDKKKPGGWAAYMNQAHGLSDGDFAVLFVPAENGCKGCLDFMLDYFRRQNNAVASRPIYCVVAGRDGNTVSRKLAENSLTPQTPRLLTDPSGRYMEYVGMDFLQGRLLLFSDGVLVGETVMQPSELELIPLVIEDFFQNNE